MSSKFTIRAMVVEDVGQVLKFYESISKGIQLPDWEDEEVISRALQRNPGLSFVAEFEDRIVGAVIGGSDGIRCYLHHLAVSADHRLSGVGSALAEATLGEFRKGEARRVLITAENDPGLLRFWENVGFELHEEKVLQLDI